MLTGGENGRSDLCQFLRPAALRRKQIQPDAHHQIVYAARFHVRRRLRQDAAALFAPVKQVVHPLDVQPRARRALHGTAHRHRRGAGDKHRALHGQRTAQHH